MLIQNTVFDAPKSKPITANGTETVNPSKQVEVTGFVEGIEKSQALVNQNKSIQQASDEPQGEQQGQSAEPQLPTPEQVSSRVDAKLHYEQQTQSSAGAVAQYLTTQHAQEREAIQQMVGIDLYA
ncbi:hypothetical protein [Shewanella sp. UCD-KL12]|uniref:hypothetical protein n=1 Tax=Shewanella sp. UCD-KL12 TaxID=1917163 RepID=UPI000970C17A|nr:hypothetical protein [Shewanella sp. UCD-KL12]